MPSVSFVSLGCAKNLVDSEIIAGHLREAGLSAEQIQAAVRIAAVVHAIAATLDGEAHVASTLEAAA